MTEPNKNVQKDAEKDILFSRSIKAGKRIYYIDVKKDRRNETYLTITENKKIVRENPDNGMPLYEKHKIFLYKEDFERFREGLEEALKFAESNTERHAAKNEFPDDASLNQPVQFDIDF